MQRALRVIGESATDDRPDAPALRVFILGNVALHRDGLAQLVGTDARIQIVGADSPGPGTLARIGELLPEIVILDLPAPERFSDARALQAAAPEVRVVAVGVPEADDDVVHCAEAGISGYVPPEASAAELTATLACVARGELPCSPRIAAALMRRLASRTAAPSLAWQPGDLTRREREIVELVAQGLSNKEIGHVLSIEATTVKTHVHHILGKLGLRRRSEIAALPQTARGEM
jgi:two-component system, NarL family, nitrate/nitrite response regulator NarL